MKINHSFISTWTADKRPQAWSVKFKIQWRLHSPEIYCRFHEILKRPIQNRRKYDIHILVAFYFLQPLNYVAVTFRGNKERQNISGVLMKEPSWKWCIKQTQKISYAFDSFILELFAPGNKQNASELRFRITRNSWRNVIHAYIVICVTVSSFQPLISVLPVAKGSKRLRLSPFKKMSDINILWYIALNSFYLIFAYQRWRVKSQFDLFLHIQMI